MSEPNTRRLRDGQSSGLTVGRLIILCWVVFAFACTRPAPEASGAAADCDVLFLGGRIADGSGAPAFRADVCVRGDHIAELVHGISETRH